MDETSADELSAVLRSAVARYAGRFHAAVVDEHHVASPLGAWLLLALLAPVAEGAARERLEDALGTDATTARAAVEALLAAPHPAVASALALWTRPGLVAPAYDDWAGALPAAPARGPLPDQAGLDAWAREKTLGIVDRFPLQVGDETLTVLASALATKVQWSATFGVVPAGRLGGDWAARVERVLLSDEAHRAAVVDHSVGRLGAHVVGSERGDLTVVSVVADHAVSRRDVLRAAHDVALATVVAPWGAALPGQVDPFDLPLGEGHAWTVTESAAEVTAPDGRERVVRAVLPAWSAGLTLDLLGDGGLGFADAVTTLGLLVAPDGGTAGEARQVAKARYTATGFEAAAVTGAESFDGMPVTRSGVRREVELRFDRPYAVVAVATDPRGTGPWHGVPVFSAWVAEPTEADDPWAPGAP